MSQRLKFMIFGHGRHGKDTVAELFALCGGYTFESSSMICCREFIFAALAPIYGYDTVNRERGIEQCFADRVNHRAEWHDLICQYNHDDPARLSRRIFRDYDIYVGNRNPREYYAAKSAGLFCLGIYVDASDRLPLESYASFKLTKRDADIVIDNNNTTLDLVIRVSRLVESLTLPMK